MKHLARLLVATLCFVLLAGCGSTQSNTAESTKTVTEKTESPVTATENSTEEAVTSTATISYPLADGTTLTIAHNPNGLISSILDDDLGFTESPAYQAMVEATGVDLDWNLYSEATWDEQFNILMASSDWPDLFDCGVTSRYATGIAGLLEDEVVVELSEYLEEYAPDYLNLLNSNAGFAESVIQEDGSIVEFATATETYQEKGLMIRQDWLDELGLEAPATVDELTDVLKAFQSEYGLTMSLMVYAGLDTGLTYTYNVDRRGFSNSGMGWIVNDGVVKCTFDTDGFRDYLALLNQYYQDGLFNDDFVNISDELNTVSSTYLSGECGVFYAGVSAMAESQAASATDPDFKLTALPDIKVNADDPNSGVAEITYTGVNSISISTQCEDVETAIMFCNYFYTEAGQLLANWGVEGETYNFDDNGDPQFTDTVLKDEECFMYMLTQTKYSLQWAPTIFDNNVSVSSYDDAQKQAMELWTNCRESYLMLPKNATATTEEQEVENEYEADVATYLWQHILLIATNQETVESFDEVIETAYGMGLTELTEAKQSCYDRYMETHDA